jgi:hypothetical protein
MTLTDIAKADLKSTRKRYWYRLITGIALIYTAGMCLSRIEDGSHFWLFGLVVPLFYMWGATMLNNATRDYLALQAIKAFLEYHENDMQSM